MLLTSLKISHFRNHRELCLDRLGRINLIAGRNGAGKTSLLEAVWLFGGADSPALSARVENGRGMSTGYSRDVFRDIFYRFDPGQPAHISAQGDWGTKPRSLNIQLQKSSIQPDLTDLNMSQTESDVEIIFSYTDDQDCEYLSRAFGYERVISFPSLGSGGTTESGIQEEAQRIPQRPHSVFMASAHRETEQSVAARLGQLQLQGIDQEILVFLRQLEPKLNALNSITLGSKSVVHASIEGLSRPIPVRLVGEGFNRILELALAMDTARGGQLLVDEIENGLHYSVLQDVFSILSDLAQQFDVQIFATTHSAECIDSAHQAFLHKDTGELAVFRLDRTPERTKAVRFDRENLNTAVQFNMEIR